MHFVFEYINNEQKLNFINCKDKNPSEISRFTVSPLADTILMASVNTSVTLNLFSLKHNVTCGLEPLEGKPYIIASGVSHSPEDWTGGAGSEKQSLFYFLKDSYLEDLRKGRAFLLLDQSHEGYQTDWLWAWFHDNLKEYSIPATQIIYVTGNLLCDTQYTEWADANSIDVRMSAIPYPHFESMIYETTLNFNRGLYHVSDTKGRRTPTCIEHIRYKTNNSNSIKVYNALQKRPRAHRFWLFKSLVDAGLLSDGINTVNAFKHGHVYFDGKDVPSDDFFKINELTPIMPADTYINDLTTFATECGGNYIGTLNENVMLDSYVTVISEASASDNDNTCFISEKTFKPIACYHPFIIWGNRGSLSHLHDMGYKTFSPFIDESYDTLSTWDRLDAIIKELKKIQAIPVNKRISWYRQFEDILEHNFLNLRKNSKEQVFPAMTQLVNHIEKCLEGK